MNKTLKQDFDIWWNMRKYKTKDIPAKKYGNRKIIDTHALNHGWPGPETDVNYWVELDNGMAVGFREPKLGKAEFPVYDVLK
jgi:hypothetical protein